MGKVRVKTFGDEEKDLKAQQKKEAKKALKKAEKEALKAEEKETVVKAVETPKAEATVEVTMVEESTKQGGKNKTKKEKFAAKKKAPHSKRFKEATSLVDKSKTYTLADALSLLEKLQKAKFDETVELHINTHEAGISGNMNLPHGTGKVTRVVIADEDVIKEIESGKINFDILVAHPSMMPKLAKVAKILGPRGLMPNPKAGTITPKPEDVAKQYASGQTRYRTETKAPIIHLTVGKISFGNKKLSENIEEALRTIQSKNIRTVTLKSTMSPGIKISVI